MKKLLFLVLFAPALLNGAANHDDNNNNNLVQQFQNLHINNNHINNNDNNDPVQGWITIAQKSYNKIQNRRNLASRRKGFRAFVNLAQKYLDSHEGQLNDAQVDIVVDLINRARPQAVESQGVVRNLNFDFALNEDQDG